MYKEYASCSRNSSKWGYKGLYRGLYRQLLYAGY